MCVCVCDMQTAIRAFSHAGKLIQRRPLGQLVQQQLIVAFMCVCACVRVCVLVLSICKRYKINLFMIRRPKIQQIATTIATATAAAAATIDFCIRHKNHKIHMKSH